MKIDVNKVARKVEVDNAISLGYYYRIADNLLRQANIHREEKNIVDLYIILLRFSSLVSETIPFHRDYQFLFQKEKNTCKKRLLSVLGELEALKPEFQRLVDELNKDYARTQPCSLDSGPSSSQSSSVNNFTYSSINVKRPFGVSAQPSWKYDYNHNQVSSSNSPQLDKQLQNLSIGIPLPKQETLSRHSFLGPNGLRSQWQGPTAEVKVQYPSYTELTSDENLSVEQAGKYGSLAVKDSDTAGIGSTMESVLSLDDGRWSHPAEESSYALINEASQDPFGFVGIRQPSPPPVLAHVQQSFSPIPPSQVADPRPGPAKPQDGIPSSNSYQHLHVPVSLMEDFLRLARANTKKNLETCGVLAGSLKKKVFHITTLIIPKQEATSDSCSTLNEEEIFEVQDKMGLFPLGWIHTHPSQTCFMSSVDLHTHYSYQIMLPEAVAIVMAPTDTSSPHGIFHLSDPGGLSVIRNCEQRGFHPHEEALDGSSIYEHCSHVYMNSKTKFDVVDLR
ncbi:AMSH-like ubiquitin thioesterase 3 [Euphorbia lathyris]|uniref:AMSH-like ubiquitin thioesterase 3 n=1 Tax=Euphorbia lathyris TaxID=212925 RepID=UPI0033143E96